MQRCIPTIPEHLCLLRMKDAAGHCTSQARWSERTNATLLCGAQTVSSRFVNTSPWGKRPWPHAGFREQKKQLFPSSPRSLSRTRPRFLPCLSLPSHPFKSEVSKNMASYSARYNSEEEKREKAVPPSWADWSCLKSLRCTTFLLLLPSPTPL